MSKLVHRLPGLVLVALPLSVSAWPTPDACQKFVSSVGPASIQTYWYGVQCAIEDLVELGIILLNLW